MFGDMTQKNILNRLAEAM